MAGHWTELHDPTRHRDRMDGIANPLNLASFVPRLVDLVSVCSFTFEIQSLELRLSLEFYARKLGPSSRRDIGGADHWECERWFERLPLYLCKERKRLEVLPALQHAFDDFSTTTGNV